MNRSCYDSLLHSIGMQRKQDFKIDILPRAAGFVYNGGLLVGSWAPLIDITLLSYFDKYNIPQYYAVAINVIIDSINSYSRF